jgi:hypothetical protein
VVVAALFAPPFPPESGCGGGARGVFFSITLTTFPRVGVGVLTDASDGAALGFDLPEPMPSPRR